MQQKGDNYMNCPLFAGINDDKISDLFKILRVKELDFVKNQTILHYGEKVSDIFICLEGELVLENVDINGQISILSEIGSGGLFGGAFAFTDSLSPGDLRAIADGKALIVNKNAINSLSDDNPYKSIIYRNLITILANKSTFLITKIKHLSKRSIRAKILSYFGELEKKSGKRIIVLPFDRQGLADYICVDRSALSRELSKMRDEGLIDYHKNTFVLKY